MIANDKEMRKALQNFFSSKPPNRQTITFATTDVFLTPRKGLTSDVKGQRRTLARWLTDSMEAGTATVSNYDITIFTTIIPYKYTATKREIKT